jgi:hypothetical protein
MRSIEFSFCAKKTDAGDETPRRQFIDASGGDAAVPSM